MMLIYEGEADTKQVVILCSSQPNLFDLYGISSINSHLVQLVSADNGGEECVRVPLQFLHLEQLFQCYFSVTP